MDPSFLSRMLTDSLPGFARVRDFLRTACDNLKEKHDWFSIIFVYDQKMPRPVRTVLITAAIITVMFTNAVLYSLTNPDSSACVAFTTEEQCLSLVGLLDPSEKFCEWNADDIVCDGNPDAGTSFYSTLLLSILSTMFASPPMIAVVAVFALLSRPTLEEDQDMDTRSRKDSFDSDEDHSPRDDMTDPPSPHPSSSLPLCI